MSTFEDVYRLCQELDERRVPYVLNFVRPGALMLGVAIPGERWEIEFFSDGSIELERFTSAGVTADPTAPSKLLSFFEERGLGTTGTSNTE